MKNYKQFKDLELKFNRNRNILIGENGAGKSSILEVISYVLGASIRDIENKGLQTLFNVEIIKEYLESDNVLIRTAFPTYDQFKLNQGEQYFRTYYDIFGKNLSNYFYWASKNNQFINCRWKYIYMMDLVIEVEKTVKLTT